MSFRLDPVGMLLVEAAASAGVGLILISVEGDELRTVFVNDVYARWIGEPADALVLRPTFEVIAPEDRTRIAERFAEKRSGAGVATAFECSIVSLAGERIPVSVGVARGESSGRTIQVALLTDMRDRRAAAAKLSASERRFRDLVQAAPDGVVILHGAEIRFANRAAETLLGVGSLGLEARSLADFLDPGEIARMRARLVSIGRGEQLAPAVYRATRPDGRVVLAEIASIITEHEGQPAVLAIARDVTDRDALQANLERTERLAALGRLSAAMAHEINNPLAFVSLSAEALARRMPGLALAPSVREEVAALLDNISRGTARVATIVRDLKAFSRDGDADPGPANLDEVLSASIRLVQHEISPRATLDRDTPDLPLVAGAAGRLEQVFVNLLMNAAQALPEGRTGRVIIRASSDASSTTVSIGDDGVGIARAHLDRVFDPFFTTKPIGVGTGLGLSICHGIVTAIGGTIRVESEEGRGTTVHVRLPHAALDRAASATTAVPIGRPASARMHVLIVEDQAALARTLGHALRDHYDVTLAVSVSDAATALEKGASAADVILCDMLLPDGTGADVYERATRDTPALAERFIFMTGGAFLPSLAEFLERVPNARIDKPFGLPALEELLDKTIEARALREAREQVRA